MGESVSLFSSAKNLKQKRARGMRRMNSFGGDADGILNKLSVSGDISEFTGSKIVSRQLSLKSKTDKKKDINGDHSDDDSADCSDNHDYLYDELPQKSMHESEYMFNLELSVVNEHEAEYFSNSDIYNGSVERRKSSSTSSMTDSDEDCPKKKRAISAEMV